MQSKDILKNAATVDELKASIGNIALSPSPVVSVFFKSSLREVGQSSFKRKPAYSHHKLYKHWTAPSSFRKLCSFYVAVLVLFKIVKMHRTTFLFLLTFLCAFSKEEKMVTKKLSRFTSEAIKNSMKFTHLWTIIF